MEGVNHGVGYVFGTLLSILLWKVDRQYIYFKINYFLKNKIFIKNIFMQLFYLLVIVVLLLIRKENNEITNFITAFIVIDISNTERKNLKKREKIKFYDSIAAISNSLVNGFVAPLFYILVFGNIYGIIYTIIYNVSLDEELSLFKWINIIISIIPSIIVQIILYLAYVSRNRKITMDFRGDYFINLIFRPILNVDIIAAYIESVNFYYCMSQEDSNYVKSYGEYSNKINEECIKDYLGLAYIICILTFIVFYMLKVIILRK
ncbi:MAG: hypothetical protein K0R54_4641 [Clostridiaceae bacterium]|nr:hypothetical protein [Clostridiaceae bacterium]